MQESGTQMERKPGWPAGIFSDLGAGHTHRNFGMEVWIRVVRARELRAPGKSCSPRRSSN